MVKNWLETHHKTRIHINCIVDRKTNNNTHIHDTCREALSLEFENKLNCLPRFFFEWFIDGNYENCYNNNN